MAQLNQFANLLIFLVIFMTLIILVLSFKYRSLAGIRKGTVYYASLIFVFCMGIVVQFSMLSFLVGELNEDIVRFTFLIVIILVLYLTLARFHAYSKVNLGLQRPIIYLDLFMLGMLISNVWPYIEGLL